MNALINRAQSRASPADQGRLLVIYYADRSPLRATVADHLYSLRRYSRRDCIYLNIAVRRLPSRLADLGITAVVFHTLLLAHRWDPIGFREVLRKLEPIRDFECHKVAIPQDDYIHTGALGDFIRSFGVHRVLTPAPESEWRRIYGDLVDGPPSFSRVLPGYLEPSTLDRIRRLRAASSTERPVDIGYRAWRPDYSLGRHAMLKARVGEAVAEGAPRHGLTTDISLRGEDTLFGDAWYRFMLRCRWMVGVEGGASVLDPDGSAHARTAAYRGAQPDASFEEVEAACFPGMDGSVNLVAISPRHLEACATLTGQALVEGDYSGVLKPGVHYLSIAPDFSNLDIVLAQLRDENVREAIVRRAHRDIVAGRRYEYSSFVAEVLKGAIPSGARIGVRARARVRWAAMLDTPSWAWVAVRWRARRSVRQLLAKMGLLERAVELRARRRSTADRLSGRRSGTDRG